MSTLHPLSHGTPLSEFDIFSVPPTQLSVVNDFETEHRPIQPITPDRLIQFEFSTARNEYVKWCDTEIYMTVRVMLISKDKVDQTAWSKFDMEDNLMHSLLQSVDLSINGRLITKSSINYAYRAYFDNLIGYNNTAKAGHLSSIGWEEPATDRYFPPDGSTDWSLGKFFELRGKLCIDLAQQGRAMIGGVTYKLEIRLNKATFGFNKRGDKLGFEPAFEIGTISLIVHRTVVSEGTFTAHARALQHATAKYPISRHEVQGVTINSGVMDVVLERIFNGQLPRRVLVGFVRVPAFNGTYNKSGFLFEHFNINHLSFTIDGITYPRTPYMPDFNKKLYMREYYAFMQAFNQDTDSPSMELSYEDFMEKDKILFAYNFAPDLGDGCGFGGYLNLIKTGAFGMHIRFFTALQEPIVAVVFAEFDNLIQINKNLEVTTDYVV